MLLLLLACAPPDHRESLPLPTEDTAAEGIATLSDESVDFGATCAPASREVGVINEGDGPLLVTSLSLEGDEAGAFAVSGLGTVFVEPGGSTTFTVTFAPPGPGEHAADVVLGAESAADLLLPVYGRCDAGAPEVSPAALDLGAMELGCTGGAALDILNTGNADLAVEGFTVDASEAGLVLDAAEDVYGALPWTLAPGEYATVYVAWTPLAQGALTGAVTVRTDGGDRVVPVTGEAAYAGWVVQAFDVPEVVALDMVFVVDATVGDDELDRLSASLPTITAAMDAAGWDWQLAAFVADDGCVRGGEPWIDGATATPVMAWGEMIDPIAGGTYAEMGFTVAENGLSSAALGPGGCNEGLVRPGAHLALVGVTDEVEQSANDWSYYVSSFEVVPPDPDLLVIHAFAGDYPSGCGGGEPGLGWYEATVATGGNFASICATDWSADLNTMVGEPPGPVDSVELEAWPYAESIVVTVDGVPTDTWSHAGADNTLRFDPPLEPGAHVEISYATEAECAER